MLKKINASTKIYDFYFYQDDKGVRQGMYKSYYRTGILSEESSYKDDMWYSVRKLFLHRIEIIYFQTFKNNINNGVHVKFLSSC